MSKYQNKLYKEQIASEVYNYILGHFMCYKYVPTYQDIKETLHLSSMQNVQDSIKILCDLKLVKKCEGHIVIPAATVTSKVNIRANKKLPIITVDLTFNPKSNTFTASYTSKRGGYCISATKETVSETIDAISEIYVQKYRGFLH